MVYLYLWTEFINTDTYKFPDGPSTNTDITVIKYKIVKENTDLQGVSFTFDVEKGTFPSDFSTQMTAKEKQMQYFAHLTGFENVPTGIPANSAAGETEKVGNSSTANLSANSVTFIGSGDNGVKSEVNDILAYVHGVHFRISSISGASNSNAESYTTKEESNNITSYLVVGKPGCTDSTAVNYDETAIHEDDSCTNSVYGCTNSNAINYNPTANNDDGTCTISGCTDSSADNYNANANNDDSSCIISGCTDSTADNYNASANNDNGSCQILGCINKNADNYNENANTDDGTCTISGCTDSSADNYNANANNDDGTCTISGCTDPSAENYNESANENDGSCTYTVKGCTDPSAENYNESANENDGSCTYTVKGCTDPSAENYNESANEDDGSCVILGCKNPLALNYNSKATIDDGSCELGDVSGITGDPHILTIGGNKLELPHEINNYNLITSKDFKINISTQIKNKEALMKLIYCCYKDSYFLFDIDSLEFIESNNFDKNFSKAKLGINTLRINCSNNSISFLLNKEVNGLIVTVKKNSLTQENSSGILLSDPMDECIIPNLM